VISVFLFPLVSASFCNVSFRFPFFAFVFLIKNNGVIHDYVYADASTLFYGLTKKLLTLFRFGLALWDYMPFDLILHVSKVSRRFSPPYLLLLSRLTPLQDSLGKFCCCLRESFVGVASGKTLAADGRGARLSFYL
jgi:hypothetical protein